jgi:hypothetical protein
MTSANLPQKCIAAFMSMHVTKYAAGLYMENVWLWVADHDVDDATVTQITVFAGRGLLVESTAGSIWMYGTSVEHHALYQYQLANTANIYMGEIQTETPYYQPNPNTAIPFPAVASLNDPATASDAVGLRILSSNNILVYGAGLYSFFYNYNVHCSDAVRLPKSSLRSPSNPFYQALTNSLYRVMAIGASHASSASRRAVTSQCTVCKLLGRKT